MWSCCTEYGLGTHILVAHVLVCVAGGRSHSAAAGHQNGSFGRESAVLFDKLSPVITRIKIWDIADIALVTAVLYRVILLIRDTRAVQLVKGLVILLLATVVSKSLNLRATNWLLTQTMTVGILAIPIVFQTEFRRALEQIGRGHIFKPSKPLDTEEVLKLLDELTKAVEILAKNRTGALIIIERETGLREFMETGVPIDGVVTSQLLLNTFIPKTPLHDGAVMIRGNRLVAAACYLPLSENPDLDQALGTRHRAGIGITEQSDALSIIVSEETGGISLAQNGKLTRYLDAKMLKELLTQIQVPKPNRGLASLWPWRSEEHG